MSQLKLELVIEASDELIKLIENEGITVRGLSFASSEEVSGSSIRLQSLSEIKDPYTNDLVTELRLRGFDFDKLPYLSHERIRVLVFKIVSFESWWPARREERREQDRIILAIGQILGTAFPDTWDYAETARVIGNRMANALRKHLGVYTLADLETVRLSEIERVRGIGRKSMEELTPMVEDGTIKLAK